MAEPSARLNRPQWHEDDLAFVIAEIRSEFPTLSIAEVTAAVSSGATAVLPSTGRVQFVHHVRKMLRAAK